VLALLIGIISGTYSSIFNASPLLVVWQLWDDRRRAEQMALARGSRRSNA
jgi:preprotein translocase subunit SecF